MADGDTPAKTSDLKVRAASAVVMVAVAGLALWLGGWAWIALVVATACGVLWEWGSLVARFAKSIPARIGWTLLGLVYVGVAAGLLGALRIAPGPGKAMVLPLMLAVIATDIGAYFAGRTFGGPKIASKISPSKTWSGLAGGILGASLTITFTVGAACEVLDDPGNLTWRDCLAMDDWYSLRASLVAGAVVAITAQAGDFFESWMKRRAGVKDSGRLIPGHGGLFDRVDGLLAVCFSLGLVSLIPFIVNP